MSQKVKVGWHEALMSYLMEIAVCLFTFCSSFSVCFLMLNLQISLNPVHFLLSLVDLQGCRCFY